MADDPKKHFDDDRKKAALIWINDKCADLTCEACRHKEWTLSDDLVMPMAFTGGTLTLGGPAYPQFMIICNNCGNTKYFNAVISGIISKGEKDVER